MTWGKFTIYVLLAYAVYYGINIFLESRGKTKEDTTHNDEVYDVSGMMDENHQKVDTITRSRDLQEHQKKNS